MVMPESIQHRRALAERLAEAGVLKGLELRKAVEAVPRELFLNPGVFLPTDGGLWTPVTAVGSEPRDWLDLVYTDQSLATQLEGHLTADHTAEPVPGVPTSSSTTPVTVVGMIEDAELADGHSVLEIGTGTGYSTALLCHRLGEDNVTTIEVDPGVAARADAALEELGYSTWTVVGDGLLGHPPRAPYDRVIATCAVRRIPYTWVRQTQPGGVILTTIGSWPYGSGLAKVTVHDNGTAKGRIIGRSSFMQARSQVLTPPNSDLSARTAYANTERPTRLVPLLLDEWMPAFLTQLTLPGAHYVRARDKEGACLLYLIDEERESFAAFAEAASGWSVRQGGPVALWDAVERTLMAWEAAGRPDIDSVRLQVTEHAHTYEVKGEPRLKWVHALE